MKNNKLYLYLDDVRTPITDNWEVVRNYDEFIAHIIDTIENNPILQAYFCQLVNTCPATTTTTTTSI